jgi:hypothetical protein
MKISLKSWINFEKLFDLFKYSSMFTSVKLLFFHHQMLIETINIFIYHSWMYITS